MPKEQTNPTPTEAEFKQMVSEINSDPHYLSNMLEVFRREPTCWRNLLEFTRGEYTGSGVEHA